MNLLNRALRREIEGLIMRIGPAAALETVAAAVHWTDPVAEGIVRACVHVLKRLEQTKEGAPCTTGSSESSDRRASPPSR